MLARHNVIAAASATVAASALPALASVEADTDPDPIFAAIEAHRTARATFHAALKTESTLEAELPDDRCRTRSDGYDGFVLVETDDPRWIAAVRHRTSTCDAEDVAVDDLLEVRPTTLAGVTAALWYAEKYLADGDAGPVYEDADGPYHSATWVRLFIRSMAKSIDAITS